MRPSKLISMIPTSYSGGKIIMATHFLFSINKVFLLNFEINLCDKKNMLILCKTKRLCALLQLANSTWLQINEQQQITPLVVLFQTF